MTKRKTSWQAGATKVALAKAIEKLIGPGFECNPESLRRNYGPRLLMDVCSWEGATHFAGSKTPYHSVYSYDPMKDCAKYGVVWVCGSYERSGGGELCANYPKKQ